METTLYTLPKLDEVDKEAESVLIPVTLPTVAKYDEISAVVALVNSADQVIKAPDEPLISAEPVMLTAVLVC